MYPHHFIYNTKSTYCQLKAKSNTNVVLARSLITNLPNKLLNIYRGYIISLIKLFIFVITGLSCITYSYILKHKSRYFSIRTTLTRVITRHCIGNTLNAGSEIIITKNIFNWVAE